MPKLIRKLMLKYGRFLLRITSIEETEKPANYKIAKAVIEEEYFLLPIDPYIDKFAR